MSHKPLNQIVELPEPFGDLMVVDVLVGIALLFSMFSVLTAIFNSLVSTKYRPRIIVMKGLLPISMSLATFAVMFSFTDWAW